MNPCRIFYVVKKDPDGKVPPVRAAGRVMHYIRLIKCLSQNEASQIRTKDGKKSSLTHISDYESGKIYPTFDLMVKFCERMQITLQDLEHYINDTMEMTNAETAEYLNARIKV